MPHPDMDGEPWSFALDSDGDIRLTENNTAKLIRGNQATVQALKVALATYRGDDPRDDDFGLDVFSAVRSNTALKREIRKTLEYDDYRHSRVTSVRDIEVEVLGGREVNVHATISLAERPDTITLVFDLFNNSLTILGAD